MTVFVINLLILVIASEVNLSHYNGINQLE